MHMSRVARIVIPGIPHHVTQRGNRRADIFLEDDDRHLYICLLKKYACQHGLRIRAYCLMNNHLHLVAVPEREDSLGLALHDAHSVYAMCFNSRHEVEGHLWQGRFYSCPMDDRHAWAAVRYVERNPLRAEIVQRAQAYRWSSAAAHCGLRKDALLTDDFPPPHVIEDWSAWLSKGERDEVVEHLRRHTQSGRPFGSQSFVDRLEHLLGRPLRPKKRGRKPYRTKA